MTIRVLPKRVKIPCYYTHLAVASLKTATNDIDNRMDVN